jgi:hypothetical protein
MFALAHDSNDHHGRRRVDVDGDGKNWAVDAIDVEKKEVRLRLLDKPTRTESLDDLRANYKLGGFRAHMMKLNALGEKK